LSLSLHLSYYHNKKEALKSLNLLLNCASQKHECINTLT
jgi:hypothetical protein